MNFIFPSDDTMNIYSESGAKIIYSFPENGSDWDIAKAEKHLEVNGIYTVLKTIVRSSSTEVYLEEIYGIAFNSVNFSDAQK